MKNYEVPDRPNFEHPDVCGEDREPEETDFGKPMSERQILEAAARCNRWYGDGVSVRSSASVEASTQRDNFPVPVLAEPIAGNGTVSATESGTCGEARESTTLRQDNPAKDNSLGGETNLSGGSDAGDVRWQAESKSQDLCNPYRAETQAAPAQNIPPDAEEGLAEYHRELNRIQDAHDAEEAFWHEQEVEQQEADDR